MYDQVPRRSKHPLVTVKSSVQIMYIENSTAKIRPRGTHGITRGKIRFLEGGHILC
jgi:hypothetical protein